MHNSGKLEIGNIDHNRVQCDAKRIADVKQFADRDRDRFPTVDDDVKGDPMTRFETYCQRQRMLYGERFQPPTGQHLIDAYNRDRDYRVQVQLSDDRMAWGYVSLSTGWQPTFLLMRSTRAIGSSTTLDHIDKIVASHWLRKRGASCR